MALLIVLTMSHPHVGFYSKINMCFYAKFYGQSFASKFPMRAGRRHQSVEVKGAFQNGVQPHSLRCEREPKLASPCHHATTARSRVFTTP